LPTHLKIAVCADVLKLNRIVETIDAPQASGVSPSQRSRPLISSTAALQLLSCAGDERARLILGKITDIRQCTATILA
jgi:hypothetical protein